MKKPYIPIDCSLYDRLEAWSVQGHLLSVDLGNGKSFSARLLDLQTVDSIEFAYFEGQQPVRLDQIKSINGIPFATVD